LNIIDQAINPNIDLPALRNSLLLKLRYQLASTRLTGKPLCCEKNLPAKFASRSWAIVRNEFDDFNEVERGWL
jgi:hypothetical protein